MCKTNYLSKETLESMPSGAVVKGYAVLKNADISLTRAGKEFLRGTFECKGDVSFLMWADTPTFDRLKKEIKNLQGKPIDVIGTLDFYNGGPSIKLQDIRIVDEPVDVSKLLTSKYDVDNMYVLFNGLMAKILSEKAYKVFKTIMSGIEEEFKTGFAAVYYHDNCLGGLAAHTYKVVSVVSSTLGFYKNLKGRIDTDLLYLGAALHDIGKIAEYENGTMSELGKLMSHVTIGPLMINEHKEMIVDEFGDDFFYRLLSIIGQHHGDFGEAPRTIEAYIVYMADLFDAKCTGLDDMLEGLPSDAQVKVDGFKLI